MKRQMTRSFVLILSLAALATVAAAQDKVTVPLSSPGQPVTVKARLVSGSITVTAGTGPQVVIETEAGVKDVQSALPGRDVPPGMHRIDGGGHGFNVEEDHNVVTVVPDFGGVGINLKLQVPVNTS